MQGVEPAAGLAVVLDDEVARVVVLEPLAVLERVVHLGERHRAGLEPAVQHLRHPAHGRAAGRVVRVGPGELVDEGPVQVGRAHAEVALQLVQRAVDVRARVAPGRRDIHTGIGQPQYRLREIDQSIAPSSHLPNWPSRMCSGTQVISLVELDHPVAERRDLHEPRVHRALDQRVAAAPAVRVRVVVGLVAQQHAVHDGGALLEVADDLRVGVEHLHALVRGHGGVERAVGVHRARRPRCRPRP